MDPSLKSLTALAVTGFDTALRIHDPGFTKTFTHSLIHRGILFLCPGFALCQALGPWQEARQRASLWERGLPPPPPVRGPTDKEHR